MIPVLPAGAAGKIEKFRKAEWNIENVNEKVKVTGGKEYYCAAGCVGFARQALEPWLAGGGERLDKPVYIVVGKPIERFEGSVDRKRTLVIGDCAECHKGLGKFVPGCPPHPYDIELALLEMLGTPGSRGKKLALAKRLGVPRRWLLEHVRSRAFPDAEPFTISLWAAAGLLAGRFAENAFSRFRNVRRLGKSRTNNP
jgi:hypothetical protein